MVMVDSIVIHDSAPDSRLAHGALYQPTCPPAPACSSELSIDSASRTNLASGSSSTPKIRMTSSLWQTLYFAGHYSPHSPMQGLAHGKIIWLGWAGEEVGAWLLSRSGRCCIHRSCWSCSRTVMEWSQLRLTLDLAMQKFAGSVQPIPKMLIRTTL